MRVREANGLPSLRVESVHKKNECVVLVVTTTKDTADAMKRSSLSPPLILGQARHHRLGGAANRLARRHGAQALRHLGPGEVRDHGPGLHMLYSLLCMLYMCCICMLCVIMCICTHTCICIYIYIYTYIHTYIYIYICILHTIILRPGSVVGERAGDGAEDPPLQAAEVGLGDAPVHLSL